MWELAPANCRLTYHLKRRGLIAIACLILLVGVLGVPFHRHFYSTPLPSATFFSEGPAPPKDCSNLRSALAPPDHAFTNEKIVKNAAPLDADEIAIYKAVIREWTSGKPTSLNVSTRTISMQASLDSTALIMCACSVDIEPESILSAARSYHQLSPDILLVGKVRLVDPHKQAATIQEDDPQKASGHRMSGLKKALASGLFSLSEIAFDKERKHAIVSYSFWCSLCGSGNTWLFEKVGDDWKRIDRQCGGWVS